MDPGPRCGSWFTIVWLDNICAGDESFIDRGEEKNYKYGVKVYFNTSKGKLD